MHKQTNTHNKNTNKSLTVFNEAIERIIKEKKEKFLLEYNSLVTEVNLLKTKNNLNKKNLLLKEKLYKSKSISYFDYLDEVNKLRNCDVKLIEKEIDLDVLRKASIYYN